MQKSVFVSQVVQALRALVTIFTIKISRAKEPRSRLLRGWSTCILTSRIILKCLQRFDINTGAKLLNLTRFSTHVAPMVIEANCDKTGKH